MKLQELCLLQLNKRDVRHPSDPQCLSDHTLDSFLVKPEIEKLNHWLRIETCLRVLWIYPASVESEGFLETLESTTGGTSRIRPAVTRFCGVNAYLHFLRVACGLESQVLGETDIFGQIKESWNSALTRNKGFSEIEQLSPWVQRCFEDAKEVRTRHLQNLGGVSYGSLVRRAIQMNLRESTLPQGGVAAHERESDFGREESPVLIVGAGQIANSVAPYLWDRPLRIWNRSALGLEKIENELRSLAERFSGEPGRAGVAESGSKFSSHKTKTPAQLRLSFSTDPLQELEWWKTTRDVVVAIPFDRSRDLERISARVSKKTSSEQNSSDLGEGVVVHLGGLVASGSHWSELSDLIPLDEIFKLSQKQDQVRSFQVERAARACEERAKLRSIGMSISIPHGWEDLALFA
jgi:hypothetical protein